MQGGRRGVLTGEGGCASPPTWSHQKLERKIAAGADAGAPGASSDSETGKA